MEFHPFLILNGCLILKTLRQAQGIALRLRSVRVTKNDLKAPEVKKRYYKQVQVSEYQYYNGDAPINGKYKTFVNYFEIKTYDKLTKETLFYNSWVTDLDISKNNIKKLNFYFYN